MSADSGMTDDDKRHAERLIGLLDVAKSKQLAGVFYGSLPDAGDDYVFATDSVALTDYFESRSGGEESE